MIGPERLTDEARRRALEAREHRVVTALRGYAALDDAEWLGIENTVLRLVLDAATVDPQRLPPPDGRADLALSLLGRALANSARDARYSTSYLRTLAALAFASAGNFPTAGVVARAALTAGGDFGPFERWVLSVLGDEKLRLDREEAPPATQAYARAEHESGQDQGSHRVRRRCWLPCCEAGVRGGPGLRFGPHVFRRGDGAERTDRGDRLLGRLPPGGGWRHVCL